MRDSDTVARVGGDEFALILPDVTDSEAVVGVATKLVASLSEPFDLPQGPARISASIGMAWYPQHAVEAETLVQYADIAMYAAKRAGRNRCACGRWRPCLGQKSWRRIGPKRHIRHQRWYGGNRSREKNAVRAAAGRCVAGRWLKTQEPMGAMGTRTGFVRFGAAIAIYGESCFPSNRQAETLVDDVDKPGQRYVLFACLPGSLPAVPARSIGSGSNALFSIYHPD